MRNIFFAAMLAAFTLAATPLAAQTLPANRPLNGFFIFTVSGTDTVKTITASGTIVLGGTAGSGGPSGIAGNFFTNFQQYNLLPGVPHGGVLSLRRNGDLKAASQFVTGGGAVTFKATVLTVSDSLAVWDDTNEPAFLVKGTRVIVLTVNDNAPGNNSGEFQIKMAGYLRRYLVEAGSLGLLE